MFVITFCFVFEVCFEMNNNLRKANKKLSQVFELKNINFKNFKNFNELIYLSKIGNFDILYINSSRFNNLIEKDFLNLFNNFKNVYWELNNTQLLLLNKLKKNTKVQKVLAINQSQDK